MSKRARVDAEDAKADPLHIIVVDRDSDETRVYVHEGAFPQTVAKAINMCEDEEIDDALKTAANQVVHNWILMNKLEALESWASEVPRIVKLHSIFVV